ncbi:MAG: hypothetical protein AAF830_17340 [Pseudomonadota bacterium]
MAITKNKIIALLSVLLALSLAVSAYLFVASAVSGYYAHWNIERRTKIMDAYDGFACGLLCGKTIDDANAMIAPHRVQRFKHRSDLGHLLIDGERFEVCLAGDVILGIESASHGLDDAECSRQIERWYRQGNL